MRRELPAPEEILEELADKAALQIDRLAPVAFDAALSELTRYHRFLLNVNATRTPDGKPFNYAAVPGEAWNAPHNEWIRQYRRLFERAASRISDDSDFIGKLAHVPLRLLPRRNDPEMSDDVLQAIVDLSRIQIHQLEAWVTRRTVVETETGSAASPRMALAGSDAKAYESLLPDIVGAWESVLHAAPFMYRWRDSELSAEERWDALRASWPFLRRHLHNTAYMLAVSVWNEDERGAASFRDALVRWTQTLSHLFDERTYFVDQRIVFPDVIPLTLASAHERLKLLSPEHDPAPGPDDLFGIVLRGAHNDVLLLTAALFLHWSMHQKQATDIGARTAADLLGKRVESNDDESPHVVDKSFGSLIMDIIRLESSGDYRSESTYGGDLDSLLQSLDQMTERRVVPGRVFTPSTLHDREGLKGALLVLLMAKAPEAYDALVNRIRDLVKGNQAHSWSDGAQRDVLRSLERFLNLLDAPSDPVKRGLTLLKPDSNFATSSGRVRSSIAALVDTIKAEREARLKQMPIDTEAIADLRDVAERAMMARSDGVRFFKDFSVEKTPKRDNVEASVLRLNGITKAQLVGPSMSSSQMAGLSEIYGSRVAQYAGHVAWNSFIRQSRKRIELNASIEEPAFWKRAKRLARDVGAEPILLVSMREEARTLRDIMRRPRQAKTLLQIERRPTDHLDNSYVATVNGIDVYGVDFEPKTTWLFSPFRLQSLRYAAMDDNGNILHVSFHPTEDLVGSLVTEFRQEAIWADWMMYEIICK